MQLLISKHSRGCVPSAPCRGREHGREMVCIIIGQKSTNTRRHSERTEGAIRNGPAAESGAQAAGTEEVTGANKCK